MMHFDFLVGELDPAVTEAVELGERWPHISHRTMFVCCLTRPATRSVFTGMTAD